MENPGSVEIKEGDCFVHNQKRKLRRVLGVFKGYVFYSTGGNKNKWATLDDFKLWLADESVQCVYKAGAETCAA